MGKGKRTKQERKNRPPRAELAPDEPMPDSIDAPVKSDAYFQRRGQQYTHARLFLLHVAAFVNDCRDARVPLDQLEAQRPDETNEQWLTRTNASLLLLDVQRMAGSWKRLCAEELTYVRPSDAGWVAHLILLHALAWAQEAGYEIDPAALTGGARHLIGALCPAQHWMAALDVLDNLVRISVVPGSLHEVTEANAQQHPVATVHAAAAIMGWLYSQPDCVPDPGKALLDIIDPDRTGPPAAG